MPTTQPPSTAPVRPRFHRASQWAAAGVLGSTLVAAQTASMLASASTVQHLAALVPALVLADPVGRCFRKVIELSHLAAHSPWLSTAHHVGRRTWSAASLAVYGVGFTGMATTASALADHKSPFTAAVALGVTALACATFGMMDAVAATRSALDTFAPAPPATDTQRFAAPEDPPKPPRRRTP